MKETPAPAAPAPPATPAQTISATRDAAEKGDFNAFDKAHVAARHGKPLPDVPAPAAKADAKPAAASAEAKPAETPAATPPREISKTQQRINDYERRIADQAQELETLRAAKPIPPAGRDPEAPAPTAKAAEWKRYKEMPDAPKLADFMEEPDALEAHAAAMALFVADKRHEERQTNERDRQGHEAKDRILREQGERFTTSLRTAHEADPEFISKIPPSVVQAKPLSALTAAEAKTATFSNVVAEAAFRSENPAALLLHLGANQADVDKIANLNPSLWLDALARLDGRLSAGTATADASTPASPPAAPQPDDIITKAPPPPPILTKPSSSADPKAAALARGDFRTFDQLEMQERRAKRQATA